MHLHGLARNQNSHVDVQSAQGISCHRVSSLPRTSTSLARRISSLSRESEPLLMGLLSPLLLLSLIPHIEIHGIAHVEKYRWWIQENRNDKKNNRDDLHIRR